MNSADPLNTESEWIPLEFSLVLYPKGDLIGKLLALISLSHFGILSAFVALIIFRRDLHTITLFIGLLINVLLNAILKQIWAEPRPVLRQTDSLVSEYGMPSNHSQFMWYLAMYMFYFVFFRSNYLNSDTITCFWKLLVVVVFFVWSLLVTFSRVYLKYHTIEQVMCGIIVGVTFATIWFVLTQTVFTPYFPVVASWKISEVLLIRDTTLIPNIFWFEYISTRQEVRSRRRKSDSRKSQ